MAPQCETLSETTAMHDATQKHLCQHARAVVIFMLVINGQAQKWIVCIIGSPSRPATSRLNKLTKADGTGNSMVQNLCFEFCAAICVLHFLFVFILLYTITCIAKQPKQI